MSKREWVKVRSDQCQEFEILPRTGLKITVEAVIEGKKSGFRVSCGERRLKDLYGDVESAKGAAARWIPKLIRDLEESQVLMRPELKLQ